MNDNGNFKVSTPGDRELAISRTFDAPRVVVFEAYTRPELVKRWLGILDGWTMAVCDIDLRVGGTYRYLWRNSDGSEMGMGGVYREIIPGERIVFTELFDEPWYEGEALDSVDFVEKDGRTTLTTTVRYQSPAVRDGVLKSPMKDGLAVSFNKLDELLTLPAARETVRASR